MHFYATTDYVEIFYFTNPYVLLLHKVVGVTRLDYPVRLTMRCPQRTNQRPAVIVAFSILTGASDRPVYTVCSTHGGRIYLRQDITTRIPLSTSPIQIFQALFSNRKKSK